MEPVQIPPPFGPKTPMGLLATMMQLRAYRPPDPFFEVSASGSAEEERALVRARRQEARHFYHSVGHRVSSAIVVLIVGSMFLMASVLFIPLGIRWMMNPSGSGYARGFAYSVLYALIAFLIAFPVVRQHMRVASALQALQARLGGSYVVNDYDGMLDWLDAHWPGATPEDEIEPPMPTMERRWDLCTSYEGRPLLLHVKRRWGSRRVAPVRRISLYLSAPKDGSVDPRVHDSAMQELHNLGFWAKRCTGGVYLCHEGISQEALEVERIAKVLRLADGMAHERGTR